MLQVGLNFPTGQVGPIIKRPGVAHGFVVE